MQFVSCIMDSRIGRTDKVLGLRRPHKERCSATTGTATHKMPLAGTLAAVRDSCEASALLPKNHLCLDLLTAFRKG
jgi:hypothetical protein